MSDSGKEHPPVALDIFQHILYLLEEQYLRLTPISLEKKVREALPHICRDDVRSAIKTLVEKGCLGYTNTFSTSYLIRVPNAALSAVFRTIQLTDLKDQDASAPLLIKLHDGTAFGNGDHPTTQLCLHGITAAIERIRALNRPSGWRAVDVGTGSGVLAIAVGIYGAEKVIAIDTDPVACHEARANTQLNGLEERVDIVAGDVHVLGAASFDLILANLRPPTIKKCWRRINAAAVSGAMGVFSGFRSDENSFLQDEKISRDWKMIRENHNRGWAMVLMQKK